MVATNATTAWLGVALATGGGGMAAGATVLAAIPVVGGLANISAAGYGIYKWINS